jgi:hypothetical protein
VTIVAVIAVPFLARWANWAPLRLWCVAKPEHDGFHVLDARHPSVGRLSNAEACW